MSRKRWRYLVTYERQVTIRETVEIVAEQALLPHEVTAAMDRRDAHRDPIAPALGVSRAGGAYIIEKGPRRIINETFGATVEV